MTKVIFLVVIFWVVVMLLIWGLISALDNHDDEAKACYNAGGTYVQIYLDNRYICTKIDKVTYE